MLNPSNLTLDDYARIIVKPMILAAIERGDLDYIISDPDVWLSIAKDNELTEAACKRLLLIAKGKPLYNAKIGSNLKVRLPNDSFTSINTDNS